MVKGEVRSSSPHVVTPMLARDEQVSEGSPILVNTLLAISQQ